MNNLQSKHTKGEWLFHAKLSGSENHRGFYIALKTGMTLAEVRPLDPDGEEGEANARLMTASKTMLRALQTAENALANSYDVLEHPATPDCHAALALKEVREAITAATKESA